MTTIVELSLDRQEGTPWGFRLQGGVDFEKCLSISSVTQGSASHQSGLKTGDVLLTINGLEAMLLTHKQAQEALLSSGNTVELVVQRVGTPDLPSTGTWKPKVDLVGGPAVEPSNPGQTYTKTSLEATQVQEEPHWDAKHNITAKAFQPTSSGPGPISAASTPGAAPAVSGPGAAAGPPGFKSISAPITKPTSAPAPTGPPKQQHCWMCNKHISGVFLQVKGHPLHAECFTCSICHSSLKNVGHFLLGGKLYCQAHAMQAQAQLQGGDCEPGKVQGEPGNQGGGVPQGLAANLARLAIRPQGPPAGPPGPGAPTPPGPGAPTPAGPSPGSAAWEDKLNANTARMAGNAEDFTKAFMKQLGGGH